MVLNNTSFSYTMKTNIEWNEYLSPITTIYLKVSYHSREKLLFSAFRIK